MITCNTAFENLSPLTNYLTALEEVTETPTVTTIANLTAADATLTSRAVLYASREFVHGEGYRTYGFKPCTISDGIQARARLALYEPGSQEYYEAYSQVLTSGTGRPDPDGGSEEIRRSSARGALISLGGKLAVSGAFIENQIVPAYAAIRQSLHSIGKGDDNFTKFGLDRISRGLLDEYVYTRQKYPPRNPISNSEARQNIGAAWRVVGRPYGVFTKFIAAFVS